MLPAGLRPASGMTKTGPTCFRHDEDGSGLLPACLSLASGQPAEPGLTACCPSSITAWIMAWI